MIFRMFLMYKNEAGGGGMFKVLEKIGKIGLEG